MTRGPVLLAVDNLTPPSRTPWGGRRIVDHYKQGLVSVPAAAPVGESWEMSVEPSFPSRCADNQELLADRIARDPDHWLGQEEAGAVGQTPLLVKLLNAADALSLQVHPRDDDPGLAPHESGKPEAWVILDAEPSARLYIGFRRDVAREDVAERLVGQGSLVDLMNVVPVRAGDAFQIPAGMPHAIGAGLTLLEPQLVRPGRIGVTYRYWDWNRRYLNGRPDPGGQARELHVERSLAVTDWSAPRGDDCVEHCRLRPEQRGDVRIYADGPWCRLVEWRGAGASRTHTDGRLICFVCTAGACEVRTELGAVSVRMGCTAVVPAGAGSVELARSQGTHLFGIQTRG